MLFLEEKSSTPTLGPFQEFIDDQPVAFSYSYDLELAACVLRKIPLNKVGTTQGAVLLPRFEHNIRLLVPKGEENTFCDNCVKGVIKHATRDKKKMQELGRHGITKKNIDLVLRKAAQLVLMAGAPTFFETKTDKFTQVLVIRVDQVVAPGTVPKHLANQYLHFSFGWYYAASQDPNAQGFPRTKKDQERVAADIWDDYNNNARATIDMWADGCRENPTGFLSLLTLKEFFKVEYEETTKSFRQFVSSSRLHLARSFERGMRCVKTPVMHILRIGQKVVSRLCIRPWASSGGTKTETYGLQATGPNRVENRRGSIPLERSS